MMVNEHSFLWLHEAQEDRFARELEWRRVAAERLGQATNGRPSGSRPRRRLRDRLARVARVGQSTHA